ncbi:MAG: cytochrome c family protein [Tahibacter sp.]
MRLRTWIVAVSVFLLPALSAAQSAVEAIDAHKHLGVASCSNSVCHGASQVFKDSHVMQNEFAIWQETDPHAKAYALLDKPASREIARKLGIGDATKAKVCLDCHTDNIAASQRGERFQVSDGVGCESCHGGAEQWLNAHADKKVAHADNLAKGMYPTSDPLRRAQLCLGCHMGTRDRMITHRIMGAGHPRLSFELDTFTWLGRPHYVIDEDWIARKGDWNGVRDWAVGQGVAADNLLDQLTDAKAGWQGIFPELVLFNCYACHKRMSDKSWGPRQGTGLGPGVVRLNDTNLSMYRHVLAAVDKGAAQQLLEQTRALHRATTESRDATIAAAKKLRSMLGESMPRVAAHQFDAASLNIILADIEADAQRGEFRDYDAAEQAAMAAQSVIVAFEASGAIDKTKGEALHGKLDAVYATLKSDTGWSMSSFQSAIKALRAAAP